MESQQDKIKQREALENAYGNFVEPYITQETVVNTPQMIPVANSDTGFCLLSGWLVITLVYCVWMRRH